VKGTTPLVKSVNSDFDEFVRRHQASVVANVAPIDWNKQRDDWLAYLNKLYTDVEKFLSPYTDNRSIKLDVEAIKLTEPDIGTYETTKMIIRIADQTITLTPVGTLLIGSKGRVDVEGRAGRSRLLLLNKNAKGAHDLIRVTIVDPAKPELTPNLKGETIEWAWKIVSPPPATTFIDFNRDTFFQLILEVTNG
jgi:hypothetical protein